MSNDINGGWISENQKNNNPITTENAFQLVKLYPNSMHSDYAEAHCMWYKAITTEAINSTDRSCNTWSTGSSITFFFFRAQQGTFFILLIVLLYDPVVFKPSYCKFTAPSHHQTLDIVCLLPLSVYWSPEQRPSCSNSNYSLISWGISTGLIGFKWTPKFPFVTSNNMQGFLIKIRYKPTWRVCSCFHVLLFE